MTKVLVQGFGLAFQSFAGLFRVWVLSVRVWRFVYGLGFTQLRSYRAAGFEN